MKTYKIERTFSNPYIGSRNGGDRVIYSGLSLKEAQEKLLDMYNDYHSDMGYATNWGMAVIISSKFIFGAHKTHSDGTRSFEYDSRIFSIVEEEADADN